MFQKAHLERACKRVILEGERALRREFQNQVVLARSGLFQWSGAAYVGETETKVICDIFGASDLRMYDATGFTKWRISSTTATATKHFL